MTVRIGADDLVERRFGRKLDQREPVPVGCGDHRVRDRLDVARGLERDAREATAGELRHQRLERRRVVTQRVRGREQELVGLDPGQDVGHFHDVHGADRAVEPALAAYHARSDEDRQPEDLADGDAFHGVEILDSRAPRQCEVLTVTNARDVPRL